jgi:hypothetical protein
LVNSQRARRFTGTAARSGERLAEDDDSYFWFATTMSRGQCNQIGLAVHELPNKILACMPYVLRPGTSLMRAGNPLRAENERPRVELAGAQS